MLLWKEGIDETLMGICLVCIDLIVDMLGMSLVRIFGFMAIQKLGRSATLGSYFNEVLSQEDHFSTALRLESQIESFRQVIEICRLTEVNFREPRSTWYRSKIDETAT